MFTTVDQTGNRVMLQDPPVRIVSLVPSQTELLHYLGLEEEVVGITKFCVHPQSWFRSKARVGGTKAVHIDAVKALAPNLIIANKEENVKEQVEALQQIAPVWVSDINNLGDAIAMIKQVGELVGKNQKALKLAAEIETAFNKLNDNGHSADQLLNQSPNPPNIAYLIWREPYMTVGGDTFINDMIKRCGFNNVFERETRYPEITLEQIRRLNCKYLFLSSEPYPFKPKHAEEIKAALPGVQIVFANGEMFSWYGSRLLLAAQYFKELKENLGRREQFIA